jgi:hypothetical protein
MRLQRVAAAWVIAAGILTSGGVPAADTPTKTPPSKTPPAGGDENVPPQRMGPGIFNPWKAASLKPEHQLLAQLVGKASAAIHVETGPLARAKDSTVATDAKLIMGGLYLQVTMSGTRMKEPFERTMYYGFDPVTGKYTADVIDTISPSMLRYLGTYDAAKKQFTMTARYSDPNTRRYQTARLVTTLVDDKTWTYEEFITAGQDRPEIKISMATLKRS